MASSAPPILPTSTPTPVPPAATTTTAAATTTSPDPPTTALRSLISRLQTQSSSFLSNRRPWSELLDRTAFSKPESLSDAASRVRKNYSYFRVNYLAVVAAVLAASLATHPFSLITLAALLAAWSFLYLFKPADQPLVLLGRSFSDREALAGLIALSVFVVFLTSVGSVIMSALVLGLALVFAHGAFRVPEDLFLDDLPDSSSASLPFLSLFGLAAQNVAVSAAANPPPRV